MRNIEDVDRRENGNTFIAAGTFQEILYHGLRVPLKIAVQENSPYHGVIEIDNAGNIVWEKRGMAYVHEIKELPNGNLMIADTGYDRVFEIDYNTKEIIWEWKPGDINWQEVNPNWDADHYYNNPINYDWTHLNDVDFKDYGTWTAMLVSIRNFDLVVEVDYTSARNREKARGEDIVWYYGEYQDKELLNHQHNPEYLENGNIMIADSDNHRIIEVDYQTKDILWKYEEDLSWARDCDELDNGNLLITDNHRVFEIDRDTNEVLWEFNEGLVSAYEADRLDNGNTLIGSGFGGIVYEVDQQGKIVWSQGASYTFYLVGLNVLVLIIYESFAIIITISSLKLTPQENNARIIKLKKRIIILSAFIFIQFLIVINTKTFVITIFKTLKSLANG